MTSPDYIPSARDTVVGYFGRGHRGYRSHCVRCNDVAPLADAERIYGGHEGDRYVGDADECDICRTTFADLSAQCQREHDEQQARWARESRVEYVIEMGATAAIRCRVY